MLPDHFTPQLLRQLELFGLRSRRQSLGLRQGGHLSLKRGHGMEFSDYRQYEPGDNPRHIDWGAYARSDKLYIKLYREERSLSVLLILDTSASMARDGKWETSRDLALALSYIALKQQDRVMVCGFGNRPSPAFHGPRAFGQVGRFLSELELGNAASNDPETATRELRRSLSAIKFPGVAVFLSDFLMDPAYYERYVSILRSRDLDITGVQVLGAADIDPLGAETDAFVEDSETGEELTLSWGATERDHYGKMLVSHNERLRDYLLAGRNGYCLALSEQSVLEIMTDVLPQSGLIT